MHGMLMALDCSSYRTLAHDPSLHDCVNNCLMCHQAVARVLAKLPSLQSMTQRLRTQGQRVLQPVAQQMSVPSSIDEAASERKLTPSASFSEAHVVIFVHGFRVTASLPCICIACSFLFGAS